MFHKFYGLTAVNIIMSGVSPKLFRRCLESSKKDPVVLALLLKQFENLQTKLSEIPNSYIEVKDKAAFARMIRLKKDNPNDPEIENIEKYLKDRPYNIAPFVIRDGEKYPISDLSKSIILYLKGKVNLMETYSNSISVEYTVEKEVLYFNYPVQRLRGFSEGYLRLLFKGFAKRHMTNTGLSDEFWSYIDKFIKEILGYVNDSTEETLNLSDALIVDLDRFIQGLDIRYFNGILGTDATLEEYYESSLQLHDLGLVGFNPFIKEVYDEFKRTYNPVYFSDVFVRTDSDLYSFVTDLKRASDSNLSIGDSLVEVTSEEIEIEI